MMNQKLVQYNYQLKKEKQKNLFFIILYCILLFVAINLIMIYLVFPVRQNSDSMNPDIADQSVVMLSPLKKTYERGDIVLVKQRVSEKTGFINSLYNQIVKFFTAQQISPFESDKEPGTKPVLRRIIGLPGDTIYMRDYVMYIKPQGEKHFLTEFEIIPEKYNVTFFAAPAGWDSSIGVKGSFDEIVLGDNEFFVLGDNRKSTDDSRLWGPVSKNNIEAKVLFCYFPFSKFKIF